MATNLIESLPNGRDGAVFYCGRDAHTLPLGKTNSFYQTTKYYTFCIVLVLQVRP